MNIFHIFLLIVKVNQEMSAFNYSYFSALGSLFWMTAPSRCMLDSFLLLRSSNFIYNNNIQIVYT